MRQIRALFLLIVFALAISADAGAAPPPIVEEVILAPGEGYVAPCRGDWIVTRISRTEALQDCTADYVTGLPIQRHITCSWLALTEKKYTSVSHYFECRWLTLYYPVARRG